MKKKLLKRMLSVSLSVLMLSPVTALSQTSEYLSLSASAITGLNGPEIVESGTIGEADYTINSEGLLVITGDAVELGAELFADKGLTGVEIDATTVRIHPHALTGNENLATFTFTSSEPVTIEGVIEGLTENTLVTIPLYSKKYTPAGKKFNYTEYSAENVEKRNDLQDRYDTAAYLWEDTSEILAEAESDEVITVSDVAENTEELTKNNWNTTFPNAQVQHFGTMSGLGTLADPYLIENTDNWRYLAYMTEKSLLSGSYYGQDGGTYVKLTADLTLSDNDGTFVPLGGRFTTEKSYVDRAYMGNFDGDGHTITLDVTNFDNYDGIEGFGLFAKTDCPYIKNLHISGQVISNEVNTGLFIGHGSWDYLYNCSSDATLILRGSGEFKSGAFIGYSYRPTVENCHFTGSIIGDDPSFPDGIDDGTTITAVGGFVGEFSGSDGGESMKNCYFAPSEIRLGSTGSAMLYRPYYGSYSGYCGFKETENNYHNSVALKLDGADMGDLDQGMSDSDGIDSLNETEFWENGQLTLPKATVQAHPGTTTFVYTGGAHRLINDIQAVKSYSTGQNINEWDNFPYMPGYGKNGYVVYKVNDGEWSATPPTATDVGEYTVYYRASGDNYHRDSEIKTLEVSIVPWQDLPGSGTAGDPYTISNDLEWSIFCEMHDTTDKYFKLTSDIVVSETRQSLRGPGHPNEFNGVFDGDGHKITLYWANNNRYGYGTSLFGRIVGHSDYYDSEQGGWHYWNATVKNLIIDGVMINHDYTAPLAQEIARGGTVSNVISNMTLVQTGYGGDRDGSGLVNSSSLTGGAHFYNCKVGGIFDNNSESSDRKWTGITGMNDFWQSGSDFLVKDCYVVPECRNIKKSGDNCVILGNHVEGKSTIDNCFYGGNILDIIPIDEQTGESTNTQGISDADGLALLDATGYWKNGNPTMPKATITSFAPETRAIDFIEQEPVYDEETGEEIEQDPTVYTLIEGVEADGGEIWYQVNGGEWTNEVPTSTYIGLFTINYKAVGDYLHRDSEVYTSTVTLIYDWATPSGLTVSSVTLPYDDYGAFTSGENASVVVEWDDNNVSRADFTVEVITPDGQSGVLLENAPVEYDYWYEFSEARPAARFYIALLGKDDEQIFENGRVNGIKYGDTVVITAKGVLYYDGVELVSLPCGGVDLTPAIGNLGKTFPVHNDGMSNDSEIKANVIVKGDKALVECLASGGKAPYQFEVRYKKASTDTWYYAQQYDVNNVVEFSLNTATIYDVHVNAKDSEGNISGKDFRIDVKKVLANLSEISESTIVLGESVTVTAKSEGGIEPREYEISYKAQGSDEVVTVQEYSRNCSAVITPEASGSYIVTVNVRDTRNVVVSKEFALTVNKPLENTSSVSAELVLLGDTLSINADSKGGLAPVKYEISIKEKNAQDYIVLYDYSTEKTIDLTCDLEGEFIFRVNAKDSRGTVVSKEMAVKVHNTLTNFSEISDEEIVVGESVTVYASAKGGKAPYTYAMCYKPYDAEDYIMFRDFDGDTQAVFTPEADGTYNLLVLVEDSLGIIADKEFIVTVNKKLANLSSVPVKKIIIGNSFTVNAAAEGGMGEYQYKVSFKKVSESSYKTVQAYSENETVTVTPEAADSYNIRVAVRDRKGTVVTKVFTVYVYSLLENTSDITENEIVLGDTVTVNADALGGKAPYKYEVTYKKSSSEKYTTVQSYGTNNTVSIKPTAAVSYDIHVNVKDAMGQTIGKDFTVSVYKPLENTSELSAEVITLGDAVVVYGGAKGGKAPYNYQISYKKSSSEKYTVAQSLDTNAEVSLVPASAVSYDIHVETVDALGQIAVKDFTIEVYKPIEVTAALSSTSILPGGSTTVTASAKGGKAPYKYEVLYKKAASEKYSKAQAYSDSNSATVTPAGTGVYDIRVNVKDALGNIVSSDLKLNVYNTLKNTSTISSASIVKNDSVTVNCSSTGGLGQKLYKVSYLDPATKKWVLVKDYSSASAVAFTPKNTGDYKVRVYVKDETGTTASKDLALNVYGALKNTSTVFPEEEVAYRGTITVNCSCTGFKGQPLYKVLYYSSSIKVWRTVTDYSPVSGKIEFPVNETGTITVRVKVKDDRNTVYSKDFKLSCHVK